MSPRPPHTKSPSATKPDGPLWIYGRHAALAALSNPKRHQHRLLATRNALGWLGDQGREIPIEPSAPKLLDDALPPGAVHQGLAVLMAPLPPATLDDIVTEGSGPIVVLDQVTDPQNIGALFRLAAAFGARGIVAQDRRTPPLGGALAKAAVGAVETVPYVPVVNIARALAELADHGVEAVGLAGDDGALSLPDYAPVGPCALVLGAEGKGLRPLVREHCKHLVAIPMSKAVESLNVATAAAIALYTMRAPEPISSEPS